MTKDKDYMETFVLYECKHCGRYWYGGEEPIKLEPDEEFALLHLKKARCKWCRNRLYDV